MVSTVLLVICNPNWIGCKAQQQKVFFFLLFLRNTNRVPSKLLLFDDGIMYNYINESALTNSLIMRAIHLVCSIIATSPLYNAKKLK
jgi:hypothetical protein